MSEQTSDRWYQFTLIECIAIVVILAVLAFLLHPILRHPGHGHPETRTTYNRTTIWLQAASAFEQQNARPIESVEELEEFAFSDACEFCNVADLNYDWWGTPFRIGIDEGKYGGRQLNVQSARWNKTFDETDRTWTIDLAEQSAAQIPEQFRPTEQGSEE